MSPIYKSEIVTLVNLNCVYAYEGYICIGYRKEKQSKGMPYIYIISHKGGARVLKQNLKSISLF